VRYRSSLAAAVKRDLSHLVSHAHEPVVLVAGTRMPFAVGALVYGRTTICGTLRTATIAPLDAWVARARPGRAGP
jgi:hypothetical protein